MNTTQRICPATGQTFQPKRSNQKFISAKARNDFYNFLAKQIRDTKSQFNKALDTSRKVILKALGSEREVIKTKDYLLGAGLNFNVMTNTKKLNDNIVIGVYDVGYYKVSEGNYKLMRLC